MIMTWKGFGRKMSWRNFKVLSQNSSGGTEKKRGNPNQDSRSSGPIFEPESSRIRNRSANHSTTTFGFFE
jgi:hypothetical protein